MKLKIIKSPAFAFYRLPYFPPLGLCTIYSYLKEKGFDISQEDLSVVNHPPQKMDLGGHRNRFISIFSDTKRIIKYLEGGKDNELENITKKYLKWTVFDGIDVLLISIFTFDYCSSIMALLIAKYFKANTGNKLVIMGGENNQRAHVYENFEIYNNLRLVDYYISGYGEGPLHMLLEKIKGAAISFENIPGLCYRQNSRIQRNEPGDQVLTMPNFDGLPLERYRWKPDGFFNNMPGREHLNTDVLILPFQISYGCPHHCAFCVCSLSKKLYYIQPHKAVRMLTELSERYRTKYFFFVDNTLNISGNFINKFCDEIIKSGMKILWSDCASVRHVEGPEVLMKMRKAGACRLIFGLETASPRLLRHVDKDVTPQQASSVFKWSHEAGIWTGVEIIAGLPREKEEDLQKTVDFLNENMEYLDEIWLGKFYLPKHSAMYKYPQRYGITNIREGEGSLKESIAADRECYRYIFDEINGLKWEDKSKQIDNSYDKIDRLLRLRRREPLAAASRLNTLFYLYTCLSDKSEIRHYCDRYRRLIDTKRLLLKATSPGAIWSKVQDGSFISSLKGATCALRRG